MQSDASFGHPSGSGHRQAPDLDGVQPPAPDEAPPVFIPPWAMLEPPVSTTVPEAPPMPVPLDPPLAAIVPKLPTSPPQDSVRIPNTSKARMPRKDTLADSEFNARNRSDCPDQWVSYVEEVPQVAHHHRAGPRPYRGSTTGRATIPNATGCRRHTNHR